MDSTVIIIAGFQLNYTDFGTALGMVMCAKSLHGSLILKKRLGFFLHLFFSQHVLLSKPRLFTVRYTGGKRVNHCDVHSSSGIRPYHLWLQRVGNGDVV